MNTSIGYFKLSERTRATAVILALVFTFLPISSARGADTGWSGWQKPTATTSNNLGRCAEAFASSAELRVVADCSYNGFARASIQIQRTDIVPTFQGSTTRRAKYICWKVPGSYQYWFMIGSGGTSVRQIVIESELSISGVANIAVIRQPGLKTMGRYDYFTRGYSVYAAQLGDIKPILTPINLGNAGSIMSSLPGTTKTWSSAGVAANANTTFCGELYYSTGGLLDNRGVTLKPGTALTYTINLKLLAVSAGGLAGGSLTLPVWKSDWSVPGNSEVIVKVFDEKSAEMFRD